MIPNKKKLPWVSHSFLTTDLTLWLLSWLICYLVSGTHSQPLAIISSLWYTILLVNLLWIKVLKNDKQEASHDVWNANQILNQLAFLTLLLEGSHEWYSQPRHEKHLPSMLKNKRKGTNLYEGLLHIFPINDKTEKFLFIHLFPNITLVFQVVGGK